MLLVFVDRLLSFCPAGEWHGFGVYGKAFGRDTDTPYCQLLESDNPLFLLLGFAIGIFLMAYMLQQSGNFRVRSGIRDCKMGKY